MRLDHLLSKEEDDPADPRIVEEPGLRSFKPPVLWGSRAASVPGRFGVLRISPSLDFLRDFLGEWFDKNSVWLVTTQRAFHKRYSL